MLKNVYVYNSLCSFDFLSLLTAHRMIKTMFSELKPLFLLN